MDVLAAEHATISAHVTCASSASSRPRRQAMLRAWGLARTLAPRQLRHLWQVPLHHMTGPTSPFAVCAGNMPTKWVLTPKAACQRHTLNKSAVAHRVSRRPFSRAAQGCAPRRQVLCRGKGNHSDLVPPASNANGPIATSSAAETSQCTASAQSSTMRRRQVLLVVRTCTCPGLPGAAM